VFGVIATEVALVAPIAKDPADAVSTPLTERLEPSVEDRLDEMLRAVPTKLPDWKATTKEVTVERAVMLAWTPIKPSEGIRQATQVLSVGETVVTTAAPLDSAIAGMAK